MTLFAHHLIFFYQIATWCGPCVRVIPHLDDIQKANPHVKILQISREPKAKIQQTYGGKTVSFAVSSVSDEVWSTLSDAIGLRGIPHAVVLDQGVVVFKGHPMEEGFTKAIETLNKKAADALAAKAE